MSGQVGKKALDAKARRSSLHKGIIPVLVLLYLGSINIAVHGQTVYGGPRELVESFYPFLPMELGWKGTGLWALPQAPKGQAIIVHVPDDGIDSAKLKAFFDLDIAYIDDFVSKGGRLVKQAEPGPGTRLLFVAGPDTQTISRGFTEDLQLREGLLWVTDGYARLAVIPPQDQPATYTTTTAHFRYSRSGHRGWTDDEALGLLEAAYAWYSAFFGFSPVDSIEVDDHLADYPPLHPAPGEVFKNPPSHSSTGPRTAKITLGLRDNYGLAPREHDMGCHYLAHELLHCWLDARLASEYQYAEPLTQFLAQRFLVENSYITKGSYVLDMEGRRRKIAQGVASDIDLMVLKLDELWNTDEEACIELLRKASPALLKGNGSARKLLKGTLGK